MPTAHSRNLKWTFAITAAACSPPTAVPRPPVNSSPGFRPALLAGASAAAAGVLAAASLPRERRRRARTEIELEPLPNPD